MPNYRDLESSWDESSDGDMLSYPEVGVVCIDCGVGVYDIEAHNQFHELLTELGDK